ncbi:hypothetical protein BJY00DRAFT_279253 [Aspergillus carlsbadensis]|nr:hypothetical protein BJY00DRAFT_279253 [Aspergillus carlsbadensis]
MSGRVHVHTTGHTKAEYLISGKAASLGACLMLLQFSCRKDTWRITRRIGMVPSQDMERRYACHL